MCMAIHREIMCMFCNVTFILCVRSLLSFSNVNAHLKEVSPAQVEIVMRGWSIPKPDFVYLFSEMRRRTLDNCCLNTCYDSLMDENEDKEHVPVIDLLLKVAGGLPSTHLFYKQLVWQLGALLDHQIIFELLPTIQSPQAPPPASLVTIDATEPRQRKAFLSKYMTAMQRANANKLDLTTVIDAGRTKSRQKRFYMAVGNDDNLVGWTAPQVDIQWFMESKLIGMLG